MNPETLSQGGELSQIGEANRKEWQPDPDYVDPEELEFRRKLENPFHLFQKGDYWVVAELFCLSCGKRNYPLIFDKLIIDKIEKTRTVFSKDHLGKKYPSKSTPVFVYKYCEVLKCGHEKCGELFFRTYTIFEDKMEPEEEPRIIPRRNDKFPIEDKSEDENFFEIYRRYLEAVDTFNSSLFYAAGVSIRSVLELLCKKRGHFQNVLNIKTHGKNITQEQLNTIKKRIGLEEQVKLFIQEIQAIAPEKFHPDEIEKIKLMMYWGHGIVHGSTDPTKGEIISGLEVLEEIFRVLYFDPVEEKAIHENRQKRKQEFSSKIGQFDSYQK
jgi:hypothetical protein